MRLDLQLEDVSSDAPAMVLVETGETSNLFSLVAASGTQLRERFGLGAVAVNSDTGVKRTLPTNPEAAEYFAEGLGRLRGIDPPGALTLLKKAVALEPGHAETHLALADAFRAMGYTNEARREAADAVRLGAELPREELLNMQGELALLSNDTDRAIVFYRSLVTFYPDEVNYVLLLAQSQSEGSHSPDALGTLTAFRRPNTSPADEARLSLAEASVNLQLGNFREAVARATRPFKLAGLSARSELRRKVCTLRPQALNG